MARYDGDLKAGCEIGLADVFGTGPQAVGDPQRREAIVRYLSGAEGWREAITMLGGTFASEGPKPESRLMDGKAD